MNEIVQTFLKEKKKTVQNLRLSHSSLITCEIGNFNRQFCNKVVIFVLSNIQTTTSKRQKCFTHKTWGTLFKFETSESQSDIVFCVGFHVKIQRFVASLKILPLIILLLAFFIQRTNFRMSSKSSGLLWTANPRPSLALQRRL